MWVKLLTSRLILTVTGLPMVLPEMLLMLDARGIVFRVTFPETVRPSSLDVSPRESKKPFRLMVLVPSAL